MCLYDDPCDLYGRLTSEWFVAARLVVDTGLHALGWTLERARQFVRAHVPEPEALVATETLRDSTELHGQARDFNLGDHCFRDLRRRAEAAPGRRFDRRRFHDAVIGSGGMPLEAFGEQVDWFLRPAAGAAP